MIEDDPSGLLQDTIEVEMLRLLTASNAQRPIRYNDEGFSIIRAATEAAWGKVPDAEKLELRRRADEFVERYAEEIAEQLARDIFSR